MPGGPAAAPEFVFELHACRWAELHWPPADRDPGAVIVARQLGTRRRRWDTIVLECDPAGLADRAQFGQERLDSDLLHVVRNAPASWAWYRDALPEPEYPWRYVREAIHQAADRDVIETRKRNGRVELRRRYQYPDWVNRLITIEHKPDLSASAADDLARQLEHDVALGIADEVWLGTRESDAAVPPALVEAMPVEAGILGLDPDSLDGSVHWHPRQLAVEGPGTRILERPNGASVDRSAARFEYISPTEKTELRYRLAERAYERGWRAVLETMRPDCRHFRLATDTLTHEPRCAAKGRAQTAGECSGSCQLFEPEPPIHRTRGWPIDGGPGKAYRRSYDRMRDRRR